MVRFGATAEQPDRSGTAKDRPAPPPGDGLLDDLGQLVVHGPNVVGRCTGARAGDLLAEVEQLLLLLAVDEHEVFLGDVVGIVRVARLLEALAYGLDPFVSLVGDVGDLGRGSFEMRLPLGRVVHRTAEASLGGLVVADQDALNQVVLGGLDLDDRGREMLVSDRDHFVGRGRLRRRLRRGVGPLMDGQCQQADEDRGNRILRGCFPSLDVFWKPSTRSHSLS